MTSSVRSYGSTCTSASSFTSIITLHEQMTAMIEFSSIITFGSYITTYITTDDSI